MKIFPLVFSGLCISFLFLLSCTKSTPVGAELLEDDQVNIQFADSFSIRAATTLRDSIITFDPSPSRQLSLYLFGDMQDPLFGRSASSLYAQFRLPLNTPLGLGTGVIDSVVLSLAYDTLGFYGKADQPQSLEIFEISETIDNTVSYSSNEQFDVKSEPLASVTNFIPKPLDSVTVVYDMDTTLFAPHLRVSLDSALGGRLLKLDTASFTNNETFLTHFGGLFIQPTQQTNSMIAFDLEHPSTRLTLYYTVEDTTHTQYVFSVQSASVKVAHFEQDYSGTAIQFDDSAAGDSLVYVQGMNGTNAEIMLPFVDNFDNIIVNKAELVITVAHLPGDDPESFPPLERLVLSELTEDGELLLIEDVARNISNLDSRFGSRFVTEEVDGEMLDRFRLNISAHIQSMVESASTKTLVLTAFAKQETASRTVLYGPGHSKYPMTISMTYTQLN